MKGDSRADEGGARDDRGRRLGGERLPVLIAAHSAALRKLTKDPPLADRLATEYAQARHPTG